MHTKVAMHQGVAGFERVLEALARELIDSTDDELLEAARDLGMDPTMRGSAAFIGLKYPTTHRPSDFFAVPMFHPHRIETEPNSSARPPSKRRLTGAHRRRKPQRRGGEPGSE